MQPILQTSKRAKWPSEIQGQQHPVSMNYQCGTGRMIMYLCIRETVISLQARYEPSFSGIYDQQRARRIHRAQERSQEPVQWRKLGKKCLQSASVVPCLSWCHVLRDPAAHKLWVTYEVHKSQVKIFSNLVTWVYIYMNTFHLLTWLW